MKLPDYIDKLKNNSEQNWKSSKQYLNEILILIEKAEDSGGIILKLSKQSINNSINGALKQAEDDLKNGYKEILNFGKIINAIRTKTGKGIAAAKINAYGLQKIKIDLLETDFAKAREEFMEAKILYYYLRSEKKEIICPKETLLRNFEIYSGGLSDFCGELLRKARLDIIQKKNFLKEIEKYYRDTQLIYAMLSNFAFSNKSGIRTKMEQMKNYISAFEKILYDLSKYRRNLIN